MNFPVPGAGDLAERAVELAAGYAGAHVREEGGNTRGDQVEFFQRLMAGAPGDPWCADFVSTCLVKAYAQLTQQPESREDLFHYLTTVRSRYLNLSGYCPTMWQDARRRAMSRPSAFIALPGDLVLYDFLSLGQPHHVGFVARCNTDGTLRTIEGNTSSGVSGSQADGDGVFVRSRTRAHVLGFIHFG